MKKDWKRHVAGVIFAKEAKSSMDIRQISVSADGVTILILLVIFPIFKYLDLWGR